MPVLCELLVPRNATVDQLKRLGVALKEWAHRELDTGVLSSIDPTAVASLLLGEPPDPLALQVKTHHQDVPLVPGFASWPV